MGDLRKARIKPCQYKKLIVGQPFKVAYEFAGLKPCPTKKSPSSHPFSKGKIEIPLNPPFTKGDTRGFFNSSITYIASISSINSI